MVERVHPRLDATRLLFDLQQASAVAQGISGCLDAPLIAKRITDALVDQFDCVFARLWLLEPDQTTLRLVASSGLYTHLDGSFARVPMGAFKVGKIAQNRVPFLSNRLPDEPWVKDREWAIANRIQGFAGYPLLSGNRIVGVLAAFSHRPMAAEFLEVLQVICMTTTIALDAALQAQTLAALQATAPVVADLPPLSDWLAITLSPARVVLVGTETRLSASLTHGLLRSAESLDRLGCNYYRLIYGAEAVMLEAIVAVPPDHAVALPSWIQAQLSEVDFWVTCLGGTLETQPGSQGRVVQVVLSLPYLKADAAPMVLPEQLRSQVEPANQSETVAPCSLSDREREIMTLLAQGLRDRNIAQRLFISESTVKFHINNSLGKLNAKNRYQGVYQAAIRGWI